MIGRLIAGLVLASGALVGAGISGIAPAALLVSGPDKSARFPIHWHLGKIDPRFKVSNEAIKGAAERAIGLWEEESGKDLFVYDEGDGFPVNFVYDKRQEVETAWHDGREQLRIAEFELEQAGRAEREAMDKFHQAVEQNGAQSRSYSEKIEDYNRRVDYWNSKGGAPRDVLSRLNAERESLARERSQLESDQRDTEEMRLRANRLVDSYNELVKRYRVASEKFNEKFSKPIKQKLGECLISGTKVKSVYIYAFQDQNHLAIVFAHEFGHAIGLKHVKGSGSLMSAVEEGEEAAGDLALTERDRVELRRVVGNREP